LVKCGKEGVTIEMKGRIFTPEFKLSVVRAVFSGEMSAVPLYRDNNLSDSCIHTWKKFYRLKGEAAFTTPTIARRVQYLITLPI